MNCSTSIAQIKFKGRVISTAEVYDFLHFKFLVVVKKKKKAFKSIKISVFKSKLFALFIYIAKSVKTWDLLSTLHAESFPTASICGNGLQIITLTLEAL